MKCEIHFLASSLPVLPVVVGLFNFKKNPRTKQNSCLTTNTTSLSAEYWHVRPALRLRDVPDRKDGVRQGSQLLWHLGGGWGIALQLLTQETPSFVRTFWSFSLSSCQGRAVLSLPTVEATQEGSSASPDLWDLLCPTQLVNWTDRTGLCYREEIAVVTVLLWQIVVDKT